jgi:RNA polymerase sigma-70 factor (ECF subfamily)
MSEYVLEFPLFEDNLLIRLLYKIKQRIELKFFGSHAAAKETIEEPAAEPLSYFAQRAEKIIDKYGNSILRMAYSYLHNMSDAEDILQDTLIQYLKTQPSLSSDEHEKAWFLKVAANLSKNKIKYNKLRETDELMEELVKVEEEDLSFVWEAVKSLPEKYSEVIHLFYQEGLSTKEIAQVLDRKESTVRSDLLRGRDKLKEILKEAYDFE